jgi:hypothetical protein
VKGPSGTILVTLICLLVVGLMIMSFRGRSRAWTTALMLLTAVAFAANAGCGGGGNGGGGGGGGGGTPAVGIQNGYNAAAGYDLATGLGSVNVANLINVTGFAAVPNIGAPPADPVAPAPSLARRLDIRDWQPAARAVAIAFGLCLGILLLDFRRRSRRTNAAMTLVAFALLASAGGIARFHGATFGNASRHALSAVSINTAQGQAHRR